MSLRVASSDSPFRNVTDQISAAVDEIVGRHFIRFCPTDAWRPHVNLYETPDAFILCVDLAGMKAEEISVETHDGILTIRGRRTPPIPVDVPANDIRVHLMEIDSGTFCREVELIGPIDRERIMAACRDGLLWITLPKTRG